MCSLDRRDPKKKEAAEAASRVVEIRGIEPNKTT